MNDGTHTFQVLFWGEVGELPDKPGDWWRRDPGHPKSAQVVHIDDLDLPVPEGSYWRKMEWAGPIQKPLEKETLRWLAH